MVPSAFLWMSTRCSSCAGAPLVGVHTPLPTGDGHGTVLGIGLGGSVVSPVETIEGAVDATTSDAAAGLPGTVLAGVGGTGMQRVCTPGMALVP